MTVEKYIELCGTLGVCRGQLADGGTLAFVDTREFTPAYDLKLPKPKIKCDFEDLSWMNPLIRKTGKHSEKKK